MNDISNSVSRATLTRDNWVLIYKTEGDYPKVMLPSLGSWINSVTVTNAEAFVNSAWVSLEHKHTSRFGNYLALQFEYVNGMNNGDVYIARMKLTTT